MPLMGWDAFREAHSRPFLIQVKLAASAPEGWLDSLPGFIGAMGLAGNFSLCRGNEGIRAMFESEADARQVVHALGAKDLGPGDEWAGQWMLLLDWVEKVMRPTRAFKCSPGPQTDRVPLCGVGACGGAAFPNRVGSVRRPRLAARRGDRR